MYRSQLSGQRARAHSAVAAAIERTYPDGLDERAALVAHHYEASGETRQAARWHARAAARTEVAAPADGMRHWRRVRDLASALEASPVRDELATKARTGILSLAGRLGISPEEAAEIHAEATDAERDRLSYAGTLMHGGREQEGLDAFRAVVRQAIADGDPGLALTASTGVQYASWIAGSLREALQTLERALALAGGDPATGAGIAFRCPLAHAFGSRAQSIGYTGELDEARRDFDRAIALAREHDDPQTESAAHAILALLEAEAGDIEAARANAALCVAIAERAADAVHTACTTPSAVADVRAGRFADALAQAESNLATIRRLRIGLYYEPLLLATIARRARARPARCGTRRRRGGRRDHGRPWPHHVRAARADHARPGPARDAGRRHRRADRCRPRPRARRRAREPRARLRAADPSRARGAGAPARRRRHGRARARERGTGRCGDAARPGIAADRLRSESPLTVPCRVVDGRDRWIWRRARVLCP